MIILLTTALLTGCGKGDGQQEVSSTVFVMGTAVTTQVYGEDAENQKNAVEQELYQVDREISWRNDTSVVSDFNTYGRADISSARKVFEVAVDIAQQSQGAFDPTIQPVSVLWDFDGDNERLPDSEEISDAMKSVGYEHLMLDGDWLKADYDKVKLELGAIGKGYALERAGEKLDMDNISGAIISSGSSILVKGRKTDGSMFQVGLRDPRGGQQDLIGVITIEDCSISTSGDYEKYFEKDGVRYHHILDPRTGYPADSGLISVTIMDPDSTLCDALSTACFVLGLEDGMALAEKYGVMAIFIDQDKNVYVNESANSVLDFNGKDAGYTLKEYNQM